MKSTKGCMRTVSTLANYYSPFFFTMNHVQMFLPCHIAILLELNSAMQSKLYNLSSYIILKATNSLGPTSSLFFFCETTEAYIFYVLFAHTVNHKVCISQKVPMNFNFLFFTFKKFSLRKEVLLSTTESNIIIQCSKLSLLISFVHFFLATQYFSSLCVSVYKEVLLRQQGAWSM